jgi:hypothetical protein
LRVSRLLYSASLISAGLSLALSGVLPAQAATKTRWSVSDVITPAKGTGDVLDSLVATSKSDAWSAGLANTGNGKFSLLVMRFNGRKWTRIPVPAALSSVHADTQVAIGASSASNAWVFELRPGHTQRILRWDGSRWHLSTGPAWIDDASENWSAVVAVFGRSSAWVFSLYAGTTTKAEAARFESGRWKSVALPGIADSVDAVSADDIWASGYADGAPVIMHWNGSAWATHPARAVGSIAGESWNDAWVVNTRTMMHWNGSAWTTMATPDTLFPFLIASDGRGGIWMWCGQSEGGTGIFTPYVFAHYNDGQWSQQTVQTVDHGYPLSAQSVSLVPGTSDLWAVGVTALQASAILGYGI